MILRYAQLSQHSNLFLKLTGLPLSEFQSLLREVRPLLQAHRLARLTRPDRHHRLLHTERVQAVSGLVNRQIDRWLLKYRLAA